LRRCTITTTKPPIRFYPDESALVVDFATDAVVAAAGGKLAPVELTIYLAPAEIPCTASQSGPL
jgi:hypothetical protein